MKTTPPLIALALAASTLLPTTAHAVMNVTIDQVGADVVLSYSGSWDSLGSPFTTSSTRGLQFVNMSGVYNWPATVDIDRYSSSFGQDSGLWPSSYTAASSSTGDAFGFEVDVEDEFAPLTGGFSAPAGYEAGDPLSGSLTFAGKTIASMGFTAGDVGSFSGSGNTLNYTVAVPEPSTCGMLAASLFLAGLGRYLALKRRKQAATA